MSVSGVESTSGTYFGQQNSTTGTSKTADKDMFLQLLVAQMKYQDPSNPADSTQFLTQTAQFTALEKMETVADMTSTLVGLQTAFGASSLVGKNVTYPTDDEGATATGVVSGVRFESTGPVLEVDGKDVPLSAIHTVRNT